MGCRILDILRENMKAWVLMNLILPNDSRLLAARIFSPKLKLELT